MNDYYIHLLILICLYLLLAQSFNLTFGLGRLFNLAHIAAYAIGAYTSALLSTNFGYGFWVCLPASMTVSAFLALLVGAISGKLSHDYFAIGTLAFAAVVNALLVNWKSLTRGVLGIPGIPRPKFWDIDFYENRNFLILLAVITALVLLFIFTFFRSTLARSLRAQSENESAALSLGKNVASIKNDAFILSSMFAGLAGCFFAFYINYIDPSSFALNEMVFILSIVIVGKPGSFWGVTFATIFLVLLPEPLREIDIPPDILGPMRQLLYSVILFAVVYWKKDRLFPLQRSI